MSWPRSVAFLPARPASMPAPPTPRSPWSISTSRWAVAGTPTHSHPSGDRKSVVWGKSVSVRVDLGGRRIIKKKKQQKINQCAQREKKKENTYHQIQNKQGQYLI